MFDTASMTEFWFRVLGLYFVAAGIGVFLQLDRLASLIDQMRDSYLLRFFAGLLAFASGVTILATHGNPAGALPMVITVIGWAALLKGLLLLAMPGAFLGLYDKFMSGHTVMRVWSVVILVAGAAMLWLGFAG